MSSLDHLYCFFFVLSPKCGAGKVLKFPLKVLEFYCGENSTNLLIDYIRLVDFVGVTSAC